MGINIWLIQTWEPNPLDDPNGRPWRTGILAQRLAKRGHQVTWWASNFSHNLKRFRSNEQRHTIGENFEIRLIPALGYQKHLSLRRLRDHRYVADQFRKLAEASPLPDVIVASYPTIEICAQVSEFCENHKIPLLIDIRDQYPDLYWENQTGLKSHAIRLLSFGMKRLAHKALRGADAITANGPEVVTWGLGYAGRAKNALDRTLFMSYEKPPLSPERLAMAKHQLEAKGVRFDRPIVAYTGMVGQTIDLEPVIAAAEIVGDQAWFVIGGAGDALEAWQSRSAHLNNLVFTNWLTSDEVATLLSLSRIGLIPYRPAANFERGITNKPVEYLANGLTVLTSLQRGTLVDLIREYQAGSSYASGKELADQIVAGIAQPSSEASLRLFNEKFHPDQVYGDWIELIEGVASSSSAHDGNAAR